MTGKIAVGGITRKDGLVLVRLFGARSGRGVAGRALSALGNEGINVTCVTSFIDPEGMTLASTTHRRMTTNATTIIIMSRMVFSTGPGFFLAGGAGAFFFLAIFT